MNRRRALKAMIATTTAIVTMSAERRGRAGGDPGDGDDAPSQTGLGLVEYCLSIRRRAMRQRKASDDLFEPLTFLEACHTLGAGGIQANLGIRDDEYAERLRSLADQFGMYIEGITNPPRDESDVARFERHIQTAARVGATAVRTVIIPGRRYEYFESLERFRELEARGRRSLELAVPIVEKHEVALAVENHKDQRIEQRVALLKHIDSDYVGACIDTGNSLALLEDPVVVARALAPWAKSVHLKDQAVREYEGGFLLGDVPLGQGSLDLRAIVDSIRSRCPDVRFSLELITRDALQVPCLERSYWRAFPHVPARDLARTLAFVRSHTRKVQNVSSLSTEDQLALEAANIRSSLEYARETLAL